MAKAFDEAERSRIGEALKAQAWAIFRQQGFRATSVDDLCRAVGIAKGSFYSFYPSKEELLLVLTAEQEAATWTSIRDFIDQRALPLPARLDGMFDRLLASLEQASLITDEDVPYLVRKVGAARFESVQQVSATFIAELARHWRQVEGVRLDAQAVLGVVSLAMGLVHQRKIITDENYRNGVRVLRRAFCDQAMRED